MAGRMYLGNQMVTPAIVSGGVDSVNGQTGEVVLTASDVNALPDTTKYAKTLGLSMNQTTFVLSWQLYDQNGDPIGQVQTVDLPLESVVVGGSYDSTNKKIVLMLQNGNTIDVPVGDLVEGLQSEITITNMLSSDLVDDTNKTHKFVTTEEKTTWNNKQNAISDLATIRSGAAKGATAVQPSAIANMQTTTNLVTEVDDDSTDTQYPSAKAVYNVQLDLEDQLDSEARVRTRMDNQLSDRINNYNTLMLEKVSKCGKAIDTMPIVDFDLLNVPVQYKGTTTQDYIYGYFYKFTDPVYSSSVNVRTGSFTVAVNTATFVSKVKKAVGYLFRKYNNYWLLDYDLKVYDLEYYGITITGTVNIGDEFVVNISMDTTATRIDVQPSNAGTVTSVNNILPVNGNVTIPSMTGADGTSAGTSGLVPAPSATDNTKYLRGDGTWQTVSSGGSYSAGTGIDITNNTISVTSPTLTNTATGSNALTILGTAATTTGTVNIGSGSSGLLQSVSVGQNAQATGYYGVAIGRATKAASYSVAIGYVAEATASNAIQLGYGTNSEANSFYVSTSTSNNWKLLGSDGKIPDGRLPIATSVSSSSTNADVVGAKLFYDTCGDIETLINAL